MNDGKSLEPKVQHMKDSVESLEQFVNSLRVHAARCEWHQDDKDPPEVLDIFKNMLVVAEAHQDGVKHLLKRAQFL
eukprot:5935766-Lingulodinium_polyedra.AAC.1